MIAFASYGVFDKLTAFDTAQLSMDKLRRQRARDEEEIDYFDIKLPDGANDELRAALAECVAQNRRYFRKLRRYERLEMVPWIGWLFGYYKRNVVAKRRQGQS